MLYPPKSTRQFSPAKKHLFFSFGDAFEKKNKPSEAPSLHCASKWLHSLMLSPSSLGTTCVPELGRKEPPGWQLWGGGSCYPRCPGEDHQTAGFEWLHTQKGLVGVDPWGPDDSMPSNRSEIDTTSCQLRIGVITEHPT